MTSLIVLKTTVQDFDGWTPLHAAAHWAQREACELLTDAYVNMDIKNCVGQTPFDVADPDVLRLLEELKKKQNNCSKDRLDEYCTDFKGMSKISTFLKIYKMTQHRKCAILKCL